MSNVFIVPKTDEVTPKVPRPLTVRELLLVKRPLTAEETRKVNEFNAKLARKRASKGHSEKPSEDGLLALQAKFAKPNRDKAIVEEARKVDGNGWNKDNLGESVDWDKQKARFDQVRTSGKRKNEGGKKSR